MPSVTYVAEAMQTVLSDGADQAAYRTGFVQRESPLGGAEFVQTLVFTWLANPEASLSELTQTAATLGVEISNQGLAQRFTPAAAECVRTVLQQAVAQVIQAEPARIPLLQRFTALYLRDSAQLQLPGALAGVWHGNSAYQVPAAESAALKIQIRVDELRGQLDGPFLQDGRAGDRTSPTQTAPVLPGSLSLADLGYFDLAQLRTVGNQHAFWLTRWRAGTCLYDIAGQRLDLVRWLKRQGGEGVAAAVLVGAQQQLPARLLAVRVPPTVVAQRRRQLKEAARRRGTAVSPERWALASWTVLLTNVPAEKLSLPEALVVARVRWQIELLFKLWKTQGHVDTSRSGQPWRILCEVYAKLLIQVIQHWLLLTSVWANPRRSLVKAAQTIRHHALHLASRFVESPDGFVCALGVVQTCLRTGCRIDKRKQQPSAFQLWLDPDLLVLG